ncbi:hypothetical protein [Mollivirus kamchatka]|nr:hypothetical protein [Mollivirus kamchatka]
MEKGGLPVTLECHNELAGRTRFMLKEPGSPSRTVVTDREVEDAMTSWGVAVPRDYAHRVWVTVTIELREPGPPPEVVCVDDDDGLCSKENELPTSSDSLANVEPDGLVDQEALFDLNLLLLLGEPDYGSEVAISPDVETPTACPNDDTAGHQRQQRLDKGKEKVDSPLSGSKRKRPDDDEAGAAETRPPSAHGCHSCDTGHDRSSRQDESRLEPNKVSEQELVETPSKTDERQVEKALPRSRAQVDPMDRTCSEIDCRAMRSPYCSHKRCAGHCRLFVANHEASPCRFRAHEPARPRFVCRVRHCRSLASATCDKCLCITHCIDDSITEDAEPCRSLNHRRAAQVRRNWDNRSAMTVDTNATTTMTTATSEGSSP